MLCENFGRLGGNEKKELEILRNLVKKIDIFVRNFEKENSNKYCRKFWKKF